MCADVDDCDTQLTEPLASVADLLDIAGKLTTSTVVIVGGLFVLEAVSVIVQVGSFKLRGTRVFRMSPIHHHFELSGWSETKVVTRFWIVAIIFALLALATLKVR